MVVFILLLHLFSSKSGISLNIYGELCDLYQKWGCSGFLSHTVNIALVVFSSLTLFSFFLKMWFKQTDGVTMIRAIFHCSIALKPLYPLIQFFNFLAFYYIITYFKNPVACCKVDKADNKNVRFDFSFLCPDFFFATFVFATSVEALTGLPKWTSTPILQMTQKHQVHWLSTICT